MPNSAGTLSFVPTEPPSGEDVARLGRRVFRRLSKIATRYLAQREDEYTDRYVRKRIPEPNQRPSELLRLPFLTT